MKGLINQLPQVRGKYRENYDLSKVNWFQVGGMAEVLFKPADTKDLSDFIKNKPKDVAVTVVGVGSNIIVRDGGIKGVVIKFGGEFAKVNVKDEVVEAGAAALDVNVAKHCQMEAVGGLEFLSGIPGTIGGAIAMNAGAYGRELKDVLVSAEAVDNEGNIHILSNDEMKFKYRGNGVPKNWIFTKAIMRGAKENPEIILSRMNEINKKREETQPIRSRTGGSTFANPSGEKKAWQLIDEAGCRGMKVGAAQVSEKHCNFLINTGNAKASDLEELGELVRKKVKEKSGIDLHWEIKILGEK